MQNARIIKGQSLFEVVLALAITTVVLVAIVSLAATSIRNTSFSRDKTLATRYTQEAAEWLRGERDADWGIFYTNAKSVTYCLQELDFGQVGGCFTGDEIAGTPFLREVNFTIDPIDSDSIDVEVVVNWTDSQGYHEVKSVTSLTNWRTRF